MTPRPAASRWPLHPQPGELESLSSWLRRLASLYGMQVKELLGERNLNLGEVAGSRARELDVDPPEKVLTALAERTGQELDRLRMMTLAGWAPWLFESPTVRPEHVQQVFDTYVLTESVLLAPGEAPAFVLACRKTWHGVWRTGSWLYLLCPVCVDDPERGTALVWQLPIMVGCGEHGCRLVYAADFELASALDRPMRLTPVDEPMATVDRYTHEAITTGQVTLPTRSVHIGVWFRLLRALLHEVSLATSSVRSYARAALEQVWQTAGQRERAGLSVWQPFENLSWEMQEAMLHAAAVAVQLIAQGEVDARGSLAGALAPGQYPLVHDGDPPRPHRWRYTRSAWTPEDRDDAVAALLREARADRDAARQLLARSTAGCRTLATFEARRIHLWGEGVPAAFLPGAAELGRTDLT